jgi:hypothetical protein
LAASSTAISVAQSTDFIQWDRRYTRNGEWTVQRFSVTASRLSFRIRAATDLQADIIVFPPSELYRFQRNQSVRGWGMDNEFGLLTVTLNRGTYYVGTRNQVRNSNRVRLEFDTLLRVPGWRFSHYGIMDAGYVPRDGGWWVDEFQVRRNVRHYIDGATTGIETYILPSDEIDPFTDGDAFYYYPAYSGRSSTQPGLYEVRLPFGWYALAFWNSDRSRPRPVVYDEERWVRSYAPTIQSLLSGSAVTWGPIISSPGVAEEPKQTDAARFATDLGRSNGATMLRHPGFGSSIRRNAFSAAEASDPTLARAVQSAQSEAPLRQIGGQTSTIILP